MQIQPDFDIALDNTFLLDINFSDWVVTPIDTYFTDIGDYISDSDTYYLGVQDYDTTKTALL